MKNLNLLIKHFIVLFVLLIFSHRGTAQNFMYAQITGTTNANTAGWILKGTTYIGDTQGDTDQNPNEIILTNPQMSTVGSIFYGTAINPTLCKKWTAEFDYRIWEGNAADGLVFCFTDTISSSAFSGGGLAIPVTSQGFKCVIDTWDNCGGMNPELQLFTGIGYSECPANASDIVVKQNINGQNNYLRSSNYNKVKITYDEGLIKLFVNDIFQISTTKTLNFNGYFGFIATTGGSTDKHSIRNVKIYASPIAEGGPDIATCANNPTGQIGSPTNSDYTYTWTPSTGLNQTNISNPTFTLSNTTNQPLKQLYKVTSAYNVGTGLCPATDSVLVTINPTFTVTKNDTICEGQTYTLGTNSYTTTGIYTATLKSRNNCDSLVTINLQVVARPLTHLNDTTICQNGTVILKPTGALTYTWPSSITPTISDGNLIFKPTASQTITVIGKGLHGCTATATAQITVNPLPTLLFTISDSTVCAEKSIDIIANGATTYRWLTGNFINISDPHQYFVPTNSFDLTLEGTSEHNCKSTKTIPITVFPLPHLTVTPTQQICLGKYADILVSGATSYIWVPTMTGESARVSPESTTTYTITGIDANNCKSQVTTKIVVNPNPKAHFIPSTLFASTFDTKIQFENNSIGQIRSFWHFGDGNYTEINDPKFDHFMPDVQGIYTVQLKVNNQFDCFDSTMVQIQLKANNEFYVPNAFTPDGDKFNGTFLPIFSNNAAVTKYKFEIYNRWGEVIFKTNQHTVGWDGTFNGKKLPDSTYIWKISYTLSDSNEDKNHVGHILLMQ